MSVQSTADRTHRGWTRPRRAAVTTLAGLAGPPLFVLGVIIQQAYRGNEYSPIKQEVSALTAGSAGWAQQLNFVVFGLLIVAFAAGLHRAIAATRGGVVGPALLAVNGLQLIIAGVFPLRRNDAGAVYDPIGVHSVNGAVFFVGLGVPLIVLALRLRPDPRWRGISGYVFGTGVGLVAAIVLVLALVRPDGAALHPWLGIAQRLVLLAWLACVVRVALRLRAITTATEPAGRPETPAWVRKFGIATAVIIGLIGLMMFLGGRHGPGMHQAALPGAEATRVAASDTIVGSR